MRGHQTSGCYWVYFGWGPSGTHGQGTVRGHQTSGCFWVHFGWGPSGAHGQGTVRAPQTSACFGVYFGWGHSGAHGQGTVRGLQTSGCFWVHFGWGPSEQWNSEGPPNQWYHLLVFSFSFFPLLFLGSFWLGIVHPLAMLLLVQICTITYPDKIIIFRSVYFLKMLNSCPFYMFLKSINVDCC